jgi:hypothetical protein
MRSHGGAVMAIDNYPPGFDYRVLDDPFESVREQVERDTDVSYALEVYVDGELVTTSRSQTAESMILMVHDAENQVEKRIDELTELRSAKELV